MKTSESTAYSVILIFNSFCSFKNQLTDVKIGHGKYSTLLLPKIENKMKIRYEIRVI